MQIRSRRLDVSEAIHAAAARLRRKRWWGWSLTLPCLLLLAMVGTAAESLRPLTEDLPAEPSWQLPATPDWLIDPRPFRAALYRGPHSGSIVLANGLMRREFLVGTITCTTALDDLTADRTLLRGVKPEASLTVNGRSLNVGARAVSPTTRTSHPTGWHSCGTPAISNSPGPGWDRRPRGWRGNVFVRRDSRPHGLRPGSICVWTFASSPSLPHNFGRRRLRAATRTGPPRRRRPWKYRCTMSCTTAFPVCRSG